MTEPDCLDDPEAEATPSVRPHVYYACPPRPQDQVLIDATLQAAHRYYNVLVALERRRRVALAWAQYDLSPELHDLRTSCEALEARANQIREQIKGRRQATRTRAAATPEERAQLAELGDKLKAARLALREASDLPRAKRQISLPLARSGSPDEALSRLRELAQAAPDDGRTRFFLARTLAETGEATEAEQEYLVALRLLPGDAEVSFALAELLNAQGRAADALRQYEATLRLQADHASAWFRIA